MTLKTNEQPFWLVWCPTNGSPTVKHWDRDSAAAEAERLARLHRGSLFVVCASVEARVVDDMRAIDMCDDELPF